MIDDDFVLIQTGTFMMGSWDEDAPSREKPLHRVIIKQDFYICQYQITMREYMCFANEINSRYPESNSYSRYCKDENFDDNAPVINVSWEDAKTYCAWRSQKEGKDYRLPTEAEWEYACRAGTTTKYSFGDDKAKLKEYAWYKDNCTVKKHVWSIGKRRAHEVGDKKPNPWGLYDMHGNVFEWCEDEMSYNYERTPRDGSANRSEISEHVIRGASWSNTAQNSYSSSRTGRGLNFSSNYIGFRVVLSV